MAEPVKVAPPLIIGSDDGLLLFSSVEAARGYLEIPDVEAGVYGPAFDSEGRLLAIELPEELLVARSKSGARRLIAWLPRSFNPVVVRIVETSPTHQRQLAELIGSELGERQRSTVEPNDLSTLVAAAADRFGIAY